jgi:PDZ domain-containing secreted protein
MVRRFKEQAAMRTPAFFSLALVLAAPLAAQSQHKVVILSGDTLVTIERGERESCSVKIGERQLSERQASDICARKERGITFTGSGAALMELDGVRSQLRALSDSTLAGTRLNALRQQEAMLAQALAARSQAFTSEAAREAFLRSREATEASVFGSLLRAQQGSVIGVSIDPQPRETDRWGAYVRGVTPNYPAERAGIRAGDIITKVDGQSIASGRTEREATEEESLVWLRLSEIVRKLEPGKAVDLEYRRDDRNERTRITPIEDNRWFASTVAPTPGGSFTFTAPDNGIAWRATPLPRGEFPLSGRGTIAVAPSLTTSGSFFGVGGIIANLELAPMNEKLGSYFGTPRGVLVISSPEEKNLGLQPGDVVTAVDGRNVDTPGELIRVLRTYDRDRQFTMQVVRQKQRQSITTSLP